MLWYCSIKHLINKTSLKRRCFYSLSVFKTTGQRNICTKYLRSVRLIYNVALFYEEVETANKPTEKMKVNFCTRQVHFTTICISVADVYYLVIIVACVLLEPAILISRLLLRMHSTYVASFVWTSTKTEWNAKNAVWTFHHSLTVC